ncbi:MAG: hypothetical protein ACM335_04820 [Deltaproteobacteria bacterium]
MRKNKMRRSLNIFATFLVPHRIDRRGLSTLRSLRRLPPNRSSIIQSEKLEKGIRIPALPVYLSKRLGRKP